MEIFNRYALVYCAVYGAGFRESGKKTFDLFKRCGFTAIINDDLAETALNLVSLVIGVLTGVVGYLYGVVFALGESWPIVLGVIGFVAGLFLSLIVMSVLDAGVATIFTVFAEVRNTTHPPTHLFTCSQKSSTHPPTFSTNTGPGCVPAVPPGAAPGAGLCVVDHWVRPRPPQCDANLINL